MNINYDALDRIISIQKPEGGTIQYNYDAVGNTIKEVDELGYEINYIYDSENNLIQQTEPNGAITQYEYNVVDELEKQVDPTGVVTTFEYDILGNLIKEDNSGGRVTTYDYDNVGNLLKSTNALGNSKKYEYNKDSNLIKEEDELGNANTYVYDLKGQVVETINSRQAKTSYTYDANSNITSITDELGNMKKYNYDLLNRLVEVEDEKQHITTYKYDNVGNIIEQTNANGAITTYNYDLLNRLKQDIDANGNITTYNYDNESNLTEIIKADGNTINYDYNKINELITKESEQDEDINAMYGYDETGKLINMTDSSGDTSYEYDNAGRITKVTIQDGKQIEYKYDELSRLNEVVYPDGKSVKYTYDVLDNLKTVIDRDRNTTTYEYDAKNRVTKTIRPNGSYTIISYNELDAVNKLQNFVTNTNGDETISTFEYEYNDKGQIVKEVASNQNVTSTKEFSYDEKGELLIYKEDTNGKITITTYSYDNVGNRISKELKVNDQNVTTNYEYNQLNQLTKEITDNNEIEYKYDSNGNLIEKKDGDYVLSYNYTVEDRLQAVKDGDTILMAAIYDGNGDRVFSVSPKNYKVKSNNGNHYGNNKNSNEENTESNDYEEIEEIPEGEPYTANIIDYNNNGKISVGEMKRANKEKQVEMEEIIFIPLGITHQNRNKYELTQYINDITTENTQVLMQYGKKAKDTVAYNYGNERLSIEDAKNKNKADTFIYNYDGRGSVTNLLDNNGSSVVEYSYDAFGETTITGKQAKKTANNYQFNAESTDSITGLQYLRARYYDSTTGRFITEDTYDGNIYEPLTRNQYLYTNNDPVNYIDPSGHFFKELWNGIKEYGSAVVETIVDVGQGVWNYMKNPTPQNLITQVVSTASKVSNNFSTAKNNVQNYNNSLKTGSSGNSGGSSNKRKGIAIKQGPSYTPNNKNTSYNRPTYGAAINPKVEKSRQLENQIKLLRQQNTPEANRMADYLQENMKKLCEGSLNKIQIATNTEGIKEYDPRSWSEKFRDTGNEVIEQTGSFILGVGTSLVSGFVGGNMSIGYGIGTVIDGGNFFDGMTEFNEQYTNPAVESVKDFTGAREEGFSIGYAVGMVIPLAAGVYGIVNSAGSIVQVTTNIIPQLGNVASVTTSVSLSSEAALQLVGSLGLVLASGGNIGSNINTSNNDFDITKAKNMSKEQLKNNIPDDWTYTEHNGFVHIKDAQGNIRIRIDPADNTTTYQHMHLYDAKGNSLDSGGNIVNYKDSSAHIPYNN